MSTTTASREPLRHTDPSSATKKGRDRATSLTGAPRTANEEGITLFDVCVQLQTARRQEQPGTKPTHLIHGFLRRLRESRTARRTTTAAKPESEVSRDLALSFLLDE